MRGLNQASATLAATLATVAFAACGGANTGPAAAEAPAPPTPAAATQPPAAPTAAETGTAETASSASTFDELLGIPQEGNALGSPDAPTTLVEYADLQCPFCAEWAGDALTTVIDQYVRTGKARLVFNGLAFIGPDSEKALRTAIAAGAQNRMWEMVELLYANQGAENSGWVTDNLIERIGVAIPELDLDRLLADRDADWVTAQIDAWAKDAEQNGIDGTPSFRAGPTGGGLERVEIDSLDAGGITPALDRLLGSS